MDLLFLLRVCLFVLSVHCSLVVIYWEMTNLLALLYVMFHCLFVTFPCGVPGQVWYLIVSVPDLCFLPYFVNAVFSVFLLEYYRKRIMRRSRKLCQRGSTFQGSASEKPFKWRFAVGPMMVQH